MSVMDAFRCGLSRDLIERCLIYRYSMLYLVLFCVVGLGTVVLLFALSRPGVKSPVVESIRNKKLDLNLLLK